MSLVSECNQCAIHFLSCGISECCFWTFIKFTMSDDWEALPKRTRKRRTAEGGLVTRETQKQAPVTKAATKVAYEDRLAMITNAVSERSEANKATSVASLTSLDGCAGDNYEYLDHTADVQCHTWGPTLQSAFETMVNALFCYSIPNMLQIYSTRLPFTNSSFRVLVCSTTWWTWVPWKWTMRRPESFLFKVMYHCELYIMLYHFLL